MRLLPYSSQVMSLFLWLGLVPCAVLLLVSPTSAQPTPSGSPEEEGSPPGIESQEEPTSRRDAQALRRLLRALVGVAVGNV